jgi:hypothetical protein
MQTLQDTAGCLPSRTSVFLSPVQTQQQRYGRLPSQPYSCVLVPGTNTTLKLQLDAFSAGCLMVPRTNTAVEIWPDTSPAVVPSFRPRHKHNSGCLPSRTSALWSPIRTTLEIRLDAFPVVSVSFGPQYGHNTGDTAGCHRSRILVCWCPIRTQHWRYGWMPQQPYPCLLVPGRNTRLEIRLDASTAVSLSFGPGRNTRLEIRLDGCPAVPLSSGNGTSKGPLPLCQPRKGSASSRKNSRIPVFWPPVQTQDWRYGWVAAQPYLCLLVMAPVKDRCRCGSQEKERSPVAIMSVGM